MQIEFESELMENQKHAVVMAPGQAFEVLQSAEGDSLFFSIGTDNVFYVTREVSSTVTGWTMIDLSSSLSSQHGGAAVSARTFCVAQNATTLGIDITLALATGGVDFLYLSLGNASTLDAFADGVTWSVIPFDSGNAPNPLTIADMFLMNIPSTQGPGAVENIFVDIFRSPGDPLKLIDRYYIVPGGSPQWNARSLAADVAAGSITSCLGQRTNDPIPGIYTFGTIANEQQLIFTPQYNYFKPKEPPNAARLTVPAGASAIATALNSSGVSNLFVAGTGGLFLFTPDNQGDLASPVQIVSNSVAAGAYQLAASTNGNRTAVWGLDPQGSLFYVACPAGSETNPAAWSDPVPLLSEVEGFAFFLNLSVGNNVLFAQLTGQSLIQLSQDPVTTDWIQRSILLPPTSLNDVAVYNSFTTHIEITDDNGVAKSNAGVAVTSTSPVSVYINDVYYRLSPTIAVNTTADPTGVLTVVQETQSLAAICFRVVSADDPQVIAAVNPMTKAMATLSTIQSGNDLSKVQVTNADGTQQNLVPSDVSSDDQDAAAKSIVQFVQINGGLPPDGSLQTPTSAMQAEARAAITTVPRVWGVSFTATGMQYYEDEGTARALGLMRPAIAEGGLAADSIDSDIEMAAGDFFHWVTGIIDQIESFVVSEAKGIYHFVAKIAGEFYDVLLNCISAVAHAVEFIFNQIEVFFEDLIKWLGFLFEWNDILRTHAVLKNIFNQYLGQCVQNLSNFRVQLQNSFTDVEKYIDAWAGIPNNIPPSLSGSALDSSTASSQPAPGQSSPQSNWGIHHLKSNAADGTTTAQPNSGILGDIESVVQPLLDALEREKEVFKSSYDSFKSDVIDKIHVLSFDEFLTAVFAIIADALLESMENVLLAAIDVLIALVEGVIDTLNATIEIPVISWLYQQVAHDDLSLMDLTCLVTAIPITICYKVIANDAPFPDDATTTALINAPDFATIQSICRQSQGGVARDAAPVRLTAGISSSVNNILVLTGGIASAVGSLLLCVFSPLKQKFPAVVVFPVISGLSYLLYVAPDVMGQIPDLQAAKWWAISNQVICDLMVVKVAVDMGVGLTAVKSAARGAWDPVSPWLDFCGNILWQVPTTAAIFDPENQNTAGILSLWGGTCFDCNGIMSPVVADDSEPISWGVAVAIATFFNLAYGAMSCAASVLTYKS